MILLRASVVFVASLFASACGPGMTAADASNDIASDSAAADATPDASVDAPFEMAPHEPFPVIPNQGGAILPHPNLVFVTYADDTRGPALEEFGRAAVASSWLRTAGEEYGVSNGAFVGSVQLTDNAPTMINDGAIQTMLVDGITNGTLPRPAGGDLSNALYVVFYPANTSITQGTGAQSAQSCYAFYGYHYFVRRNGLAFSYAVMPTCPVQARSQTDMDQMEYGTSHEIIEAATDPYPLDDPAWTFPARYLDAWTFASGHENADICILESRVWREGGHVYTPVWSSVAAMAGNTDPCIPSDPTSEYINNSVSPSEIQTVDVGTSATFTITGFSNLPVADWRLSARPTGAFTPTVDLSTTMMNNGRTATMTVTVPPEAPPGGRSLIYVYATRSQTEYFIWPVVVVAN